MHFLGTKENDSFHDRGHYNMLSKAIYDLIDREQDKKSVNRTTRYTAGYCKFVPMCLVDVHSKFVDDSCHVMTVVNMDMTLGA
jgi:hypothetical protein